MRNKVILVVALLFGLLSAFLVYNYITGAKKAIENRTYTQVVTAVQDIPANSTITDTMISLKPFPNELLNGKEIQSISDAVGKITPVALSNGEIILQSRLVKPGEGVQRLSYKVPNGMRAVAIPVSEVVNVGNMVKIGDRVDIIATVQPPGQSQSRAVVVLQNIEVIAVGSRFDDQAPSTGEAAAPVTVTVALDPQSTLRLKMAMESTNFTFTLRSAADKNYTNLAPVTLDQF
ncbi:MAG: Flp pilus assembly protein CpaB [Syntrophomonadaceae bacterium]